MSGADARARLRAVYELQSARVYELQCARAYMNSKARPLLIFSPRILSKDGNSISSKQSWAKVQDPGGEWPRCRCTSPAAVGAGRNLPTAAELRHKFCIICQSAQGANNAEFSTVRRVLVRKEQHSTLCAATLLQHGRPQRRPRQRRPHHRTGRPKFFRPHSHVSCQRLAAHRRVVVCVLASLCGRGSQREGGCWCACGVGGCRLAGGQGYVATDTGVSIEVLATYDERGVAQWVQNLHPKLAPFAPLFEKHQIEGALFLRLTDEMLREMGIDCALARRCSISTQLR
jgi:hypothetical protein